MNTKHVIRIVAMLGLLTSSMAGLRAETFNFDFSSESQFSDNFQGTTVNSGTYFDWVSGGVVQANPGSQTFGTVVYDTNPGSASYDNAGFSTEAIEAVASFSATNTTFRMYNRIDSSTGLGFGVQAMFTSASNIRIWMGIGADAESFGLGTVLLDAEYNAFAGGGAFYRTALNNTGVSGGTGNAMNLNTDYKFVLESTADATPSFKFSVYTMSDDLIVTSGWQTNAALSTIVSSGAVGFGGTAGANTITVSNFAAIPEPNQMVLGAGLVALALVSTRRKFRK